MSDPRPIDLQALLAQQPWVERLAGGLVRDSSLAQDLAQDAWLHAVECRLREPGSLRAFLAGVVRNLGRTARRSERRRAVREEGAARPEALPSTAELVERAELQRLLVESVLALEGNERDALLLRYFEGLSAEEIARRSGEPSATVRSRLQRALERLRVRLEARVSREDLLPCLCLLARIPHVPPAPLSPGAGAGTALRWIGGLLAMKSIVSLAASAAVLSLAGLWWLARDGGAARAEQAVAERAREDATLVLSERAEPELSTTPHAPERSAIASPTLETAPPPAAAAEPLRVRVTGRVIEEGARGLGDVEILLSKERVGASNALGSVELELAASGHGFPDVLEFRLAGYARKRVGVRLVAGTALHLGDVVLAPAGSLRGSVVDEAGRPVAGARVLATGLENLRTDPEELRRIGPFEDDASVATDCAADGTFVLADVPVGAARLWAGAAEMAWSALGPLEVPRGAVTDVRLVLRALDSGDRISGVVLDPDGLPVPRAEIDTWFTAASIGSSGTVFADDEGFFEILLEHRVAYDLTVADPENRWSEIYAFGVEPGTRGLELVFEPASWVDVAVHDPEGHPIDGFTMELESATGGNWLQMKAESDSSLEGRTRLRVPNEMFRAVVQAPGWEQGVQGPLSPAALPAELDFTLRALPGIRGVVLTSEGTPAAGARVALHSRVSDKLLVKRDGFRLAVESYSKAETTSDAQGRFLLYPPALRGALDAALVLSAEAQGHALTALEPRVYDPMVGVELELRLVRGGAIEGRALTAPGVDAEGCLLAFSRGDGRLRTLRLSADGHYRIEGLTPGPWEVQALEDEINGQRSTSSSSYREDGAPPFDWSCTVVDGETTAFDVDLRDRAPCTLAGALTLEGRSLDGWTAALERVGSIEAGLVASVPVDGRGAFELQAPRGGRYELLLRAPEGGNGRLVLRDPVELHPGETRWSLALRPGSIQGRGALGRGTRERFYSYEWRGSVAGHGLTASVRIVPDTDGRFELATVPEGPAKISRNDPLAEGQKFAEWEVLQEFEVLPGTTLGVDLP